jgi:hypothetical protein
MGQQKNIEKLKILFNDFDEDEAKLFIGKNSDYYMKKWISFKNGDKAWGLNWPAFLFSIFWLGYRKMYSIVLYMIGIFLVLDIIKVYVNYDYTKSIGLAISVTLGVMANLIYFKHMKKKIAKIDLKDYPYLGRDKEIVKAGNCSWGGVGIVVLMFLGYVFLSNFILNLIQR